MKQDTWPHPGNFRNRLGQTGRMSTPLSLAHTFLTSGQVPAGSPVDQTCNVSEVTRLLWTMITTAAVSAVVVVARPSWRRVCALVAAGAVWAWVDMEGPVLVSRGSHGLHLADVPVVIVWLAAAAGGGRLWWSRRT